MKEIHQKKLLIKNMVCQRCILTVETILKDQNVPFNKVVLGEVDLVYDLSADQLDEVDKALVKSGFELIETRVNKIIEDIKNGSSNTYLRVCRTVSAGCRHLSPALYIMTTVISVTCFLPLKALRLKNILSFSG
jgi:hypothetical protein